ncbi:MAG TPA: hypothetical protein VMT61_13840 [Candidatus Binataceae bacterium]|nr:hypothetical protein [Candidatus Binataceae bacterium]
MKRILMTLTLALSMVSVASAYEFHLQYTLPANARNVSIVGYQFAGSTVLGNCSFSTVSACSGRGCRPKTTNYSQTCTWDLDGNLLGVAQGPPTAPTPLYTSGTQVVYAVSGSSTTGKDTAGNFGFVSTPSSHYTWQTPNAAYAVIPDAPYTVSATLLSDGDIPLTISDSVVTPQNYGIYTATPGTAAIASSSCNGAVAVGASCTVNVTYDPTTISCTGSPYGYGYTGIDLAISSDSPFNPDFTQRFTVTGMPICDD